MRVFRVVLASFIIWLILRFFKTGKIVISIRFRLLELTMGCVYSYPLFSFQGSNRFLSSEVYFTKPLFDCQVLFQELFNTILFCRFRNNEWYLIRFHSVRQVLFSVLFDISRQLLSQQRMIYYHISLNPSSTIFRTFKEYSVRCLSWQRMIYYQIFFHLSTTNFTFFNFFYFFEFLL